MHPFLSALLGGVLIGLAAAVLWLANGRIGGISGIAGRMLTAHGDDRSWRLCFVGGLFAGGLVMRALVPSAFETPTFSLGLAAIAGMFVGVGTSLANGCTSGHGVCGISRLSMRSIAATLTFMLVAALVVYVMKHAIGGVA